MILKSPHNWSWRIDAFELWFLRVPWTARRSNQSVLKEINPEISLEGLMLKLQYFGHLMQRANSLERPWCWERLKAGEWGCQKMRWLSGITDSMSMNLSNLWEIVKDMEAWHAAVHRVTKSQTWLSDWTTMWLFSLWWKFKSFICSTENWSWIFKAVD